VLNAEIALYKTTYSYDKLFTYSVPETMSGIVKAGVRVTVPFGRSNHPKIGIVFRIFSEDENSSYIKEIYSVLDKEALLSDEMLMMAEWMKKRYFCTYYDIIKLMLPAGMNYRMDYSYFLLPEALSLCEDLCDKERKIVEFIQKNKGEVTEKKLCSKFLLDSESTEINNLVNKSIIAKHEYTKRIIGDTSEKMVCAMEGESKLSEKQQAAYDLLIQTGPANVKEFIYYNDVSKSILDSIVKKKMANYYEEQTYKVPDNIMTENVTDDHELTKDQLGEYNKLVDEYKNSKGQTALLYGITGSGKTSVYYKLIKYVLENGRDVILMVPEISLTAQTIAIFKRRFGSDVAILHSRLSIRERMDEWKRIKNKKAKLVIGTRSAIFAPCDNLGLIVIDEEQEGSYRSETNPRYNTKDIARFRAKYGNGFCLLTSATPSVETYYMAKTDKYFYHALKNRYGNAKLPEVRLIDMNEMPLDSEKSAISSTLMYYLEENYKSGKQSILLINRRGYHTLIKCTSCNQVMTCPNCSISLTYHSANKRLMCHYCGYSIPLTDTCTNCGAKTLSFLGNGTQHAEEELINNIPGARILRMDSDSISGRYMLEKNLDAFASGAYDIMVGTQMVAKGLDFPNVTLVGVLSADQMLYNDDYRSDERTFDLLTQVVGRAGRSIYPGKALIQTYMPDNEYLRMAANQDYDSFYNKEIKFRKLLGYPPFSDLVVIGFIGDDEDKTSKASVDFLSIMKELTKEERYSHLPLRVFDPSPAAVSKINEKYRYKILTKCRYNLLSRDYFNDSLSQFLTKRSFSDVNAYIDINPYSII
jgi:primosomal protein N' (replication factor Y)